MNNIKSVNQKEKLYRFLSVIIPAKRDNYTLKLIINY